LSFECNALRATGKKYTYRDISGGSRITVRQNRITRRYRIQIIIFTSPTTKSVGKPIDFFEILLFQCRDTSKVSLVRQMVPNGAHRCSFDKTRCFTELPIGISDGLFIYSAKSEDVSSREDASTSWPSSSGLRGRRRTYLTILELTDQAMPFLKW
jgi:hypothetical protein